MEGKEARAMSGARLGTATARLVCTVLSDVQGRVKGRNEAANCVYITIDDGPSELVDQILGVLDDLRAPATWFVTGRLVAQRTSQTKEILAAGHGLGNHSFEHLDAWRHQRGIIEEDLQRGLDQIEQSTGIACSLTRPPFGRIRPSTLRWAKQWNQEIVLWDVMVEDFGSTVSPDEISDTVSRYVREGSVIVFHDHGLPEQVEAIRQSLQRLSDEGWTFGRIRS
jgi:peptidoglycan/xylan/chitin deacetylase (PgdA/CDA1 family)